MGLAAKKKENLFFPLLPSTLRGRRRGGGAHRGVGTRGLETSSLPRPSLIAPLLEEHVGSKPTAGQGHPQQKVHPGVPYYFNGYLFPFRLHIYAAQMMKTDGNPVRAAS